MLETPHVAVGAAIATKIPNPLIAIPLALGSHFVLEKVPHWNPHLNTELKKYGKVTKESTRVVIVDVLISLAIGFFAAGRVMPNMNHALLILITCFVSVIPDVVEGPYFFLNFRTKLIKRWIDFQKLLQSDTKLVPGLITQLITILAAIWWMVS